MSVSRTMEIFRLDSRVVIVTGASRGIGNAIAVGLAEAGAQVFGVSSSPLLQDDRKIFDYCPCDVTNAGAVASLAEKIFDQTGRIDVLVNAAGITLPAQGRDNPSEVFRKTVETNLTATYECCRIVLPYMVRGGYGSVINVTSIGAALGFPGNPGYVAAKGGLAAMTRALALDHGRDGIRVNNLVPGYIQTAMTQSSYEDPERHEARASRTMLGRWGQPGDLVGAAIFLASQAGSYVTGSDLVVDGGWMAKGL